MIYLILYSFVIGLCIFDVARPLSPRQSNKIIWLLVAVFTLFRGLRWCTGSDWSQFCDNYYLANFENVFSFTRYAGSSEVLEPGYVFTNALFNVFFPYTIYLLVFNFVILFLLKKSVEKLCSEYRLFAFCFLLLTAAFFPNRQEMANTIMIYSLTFLFEKKWKKYAVGVFIAFSIHKSALLMGIAFPLFAVKKNIPSVALVGVYLSSYVLDLPFIRVLIDKVRPFFVMLNENYANSIDVYSNIIRDEAAFSLSSLVMNLGLIVLFCWFRDTNVYLKKDERINLFLNIFVFYMFGLRLFQNIGMTYFIRIVKYLYFADTFLFAYLFANFVLLRFGRLRPLIKKIFIVIILGLSINRFLSSCNLWPGCNFPYNSVFEYSYVPRNIFLTFDKSMLFK